MAANARRPRGVALLFALVAAAALLGAGCGSPADGPQAIYHPDANASGADTPRRVALGQVHGTIELLTSASSPVETTLLRQTLAGFHRAYPGVTVRFHPYSGDYVSATLTRFAAGDAPDVFVVYEKSAPDWIAKGMLQPLDGYIRGNGFAIRRFHPQLLTGFTDPQGRLYGIPKDYSTLGLFSNRQMLADAGIAHPPRTWAELRDDARRLSSPGGPYGLCVAPTWERLTAFAMQAGGGLVAPDWSRMVVNTRETRAAVEYYLSFLHDHTGVAPKDIGASWCGDAFGKRKVALAIEGNWLMPVLANSFPGVSYSLSELPAGKHRANLAYAPSYAIARTSRHKDAAWVLVQYLTGAAGMKAWTDQGLTLPTRTDVAPLPGREALVAGLADATLWQLPPGFYNKVLLTADNELTAVMQGDQTVDGMLAKIDGVGRPMLAQQQQALRAYQRSTGGAP